MPKYFEATILGAKDSQLIVNRLNFTSSNDEPLTANSIGLLQALGFVVADQAAPNTGSVLGSILDAATISYRMNEIIVRNLHSETDFVTMPVLGAGWVGGQLEAVNTRTPSFVAAKLRTNRVRADIRRGTLALTGGNDGHLEDASTWAAGYVLLLQDVCAALNAPPSYTAGAVTTNFLPSVFGKERYPVPGSDPVRYAYRYWQDFAFFQANAAVGVTWSPVQRATSQVSRKIGKGA